jgi:hypothetical protein
MSSNMSNATSSRIPEDLARSLTFHASFDSGPDADFALGDKQAYTAPLPMGEVVTTGTPGISDNSIAIAQGAGKYGGALAFNAASDAILFYKAENNVAYSPEQFRGTASFWMRLDPAQIGGQYADPFQLTDKIYSDDCIWIDFTKNDDPSDFRLGVFGDRKTWDPTNQQAASKEFYWRLAKVTEPPFTKDRWTHIVVTWDGINNSQRGRARLYFNAEYQEASGLVRERFQWDVTKTTIRLGTGPFVGLIDDLALFNRALTADEIGALYRLEGGVAELYS